MQVKKGKIKNCFLLLIFMLLVKGSIAQISFTSTPTAVSGVITICPGQVVTITSLNASSTPITSNWYLNQTCESFSYTFETFTTTVIVTPTSTSTYMAYYYDEIEEMEYCNTIVVNVLPINSVSISGFPLVIVPPIVSTLTGSSLTALSGYSWHWYSDLACTSALSTGTTLIASPTVTTTYYARAEGTTCNSSVKQITVGVVSSFSGGLNLTSNKYFVCTEGEKVNLTVGGNYTGAGSIIIYNTGCLGVHDISTQLSMNQLTPSISFLGTSNATYSVIDYGITPPNCAEVYISYAPVPPVATGIITSMSTIELGEVSTLTVQGAVLDPNLQWAWYTQDCAITDPVATPIGFGTSILVTPTVTTTYYVRSGYISTLGCYPDGDCVSSVVTVIQPTFLLTLNSSSINICSGDIITLTASGADEGYSWASLPGIISTTGNIAIAAPLVTTTYIVTGTVDGFYAQGEVTINVTQSPTGTITATSVCTNTTVNFLGSSAAAGASYAWDFGDGTSSVLQNTYHTYALAGRYWVRLTITNGLCQYVCSLYVKAGSPDASFNVHPVCEGGAFAPTDVSAGATSYLWEFGDATTSSANNPVHVYTTAGTYVVTLTVNYEGCIKQTTRSVEVSPKINNLGMQLSAQEICLGTSLLITATTTDMEEYSYTWDFGDGGTDSDVNVTHTYSVKPPNGFYPVTVTASNGGCTKTAQSYVIIKPSVILTITGPTEVCRGSTVNIQCVILNATLPLNQYTYQWYRSSLSTFSAVPAAQGGTSFQLLNLDPRTPQYKVEVTDNCGNIVTSTVHTLTFKTTPTATITATAGATCDGRKDGNAQLTSITPSSGVTFLWSQSGETTSAATGLPQGTNQVVLSNGQCTRVLQVEIPYSGPTLATTTTQTSCTGSSVLGTALVEVSGGSSPYDYVYKDLAGSTLGTSYNITGLTNGIYMVEVTDNTTCTISAPISVTSPILTIETNVEQSCSGANDGTALALPSISLPSSVSPNYTYNWANASTPGTSIGTGTSISNLANGTYKVTVTETTHVCTASTFVSIAASPSLVVSITSDAPKCYGSSDGYLLANVSGGIAPYTYEWKVGGSNVSVSQEVLNAPAATYDFKVIDANNCALTDSKTIANPTVLAVTLSTHTTPCQMTATGTGGTPDYTFTWLRIADDVPTTYLSPQIATVTTGANPSVAYELPLGQYKVMIKDDNGCTALSNIESTLSRPATTYTVYYAWVRPVEEQEPPIVKVDEEVKDVVEDMTNDLNNQLVKCMELQASALENQQTTNCLSTSNFNDELAVNYTLPYYHYTLYYYDRAGRLTKTVPPQGVDMLTEAEVADVLEYRSGSGTLPTHAHSLTTTYAYNSLSQLIQQNTPDGGTSQFMYNDIAQLRFSQNAKQEAEVIEKYSYTKYDYLSRIVEVGEHTGSFGSGSANDNTFPATDNKQITKTVYTLGGNADYEGNTQRYLTNRVSYSFYDEDGLDNTLKDRTSTFYSYDPHGNVQWLVQDIGGFMQNGMEYEYDLISNKVLQVSYNKNRNDRLFHKYSYDEDNRITAVNTSRNGIIWDNDATYSYYNHGPLKRVEIGQDRVQGIDYAYTIEGWLKGINTPLLDKTKDPGKDGIALADAAQDVFGMSLGYYRGDFQRRVGTIGAYTYSPFNSGNSASISSAQLDLYNGNIASWAHNTDVDFSFAQDQMLGETFFYDQLNRITASHMSTKTTGATSYTATTALATSYTYDGNGNIKTLHRKDHNAATLDELGYTYIAGTNKLENVVDAMTVSSLTGAFYGTHVYSYDPSGNLIRETGIEPIGTTTLTTINNDITWNVYGKISSVVRDVSSTTPQTMTFSYDAQGNRVKKEVRLGSSMSDVTTTYYVRDAQGNIMGVYEQKNAGATASYYLKEQPIYGSDRVGQLAYPETDAFKMATASIDGGSTGSLELLNSGIVQHSGLRHWISPAVSSYTLYGGYDAACDCRIKRANFVGTPSTLTTQGNQVNFYGSVGNAVAIAENMEGEVQFYNITATNYLGNKGVNLLYDKEGQLMKNGMDILSDTLSKPVIVKIPGTGSEYYLFTVKNGVPYMHTVDMSEDGYGTSVDKRGRVTEKNTVVDPAAVYGLHYTGLEDAVTGKAYVYTTRFVPATLPGAEGTTEIVAFELDATGVSTPIVLASLQGRDATGNGELSISDNGKELLYYHRGKKIGGFNHRETKIVTLPFIGNSRKAIDAANIFTAEDNGAGTYGKGSIEKLADNVYINQYGIYKNEYLATSNSVATYNEKSVFAIAEGTSNRTLQNNIIGSSMQYGDVRRGLDGNVYVAGKGNMVGLNRLGATPTEVEMDPVTSLTTYALTGYLPTQVFKVGATETAFANGRELGLKQYEMKDHLGSVRAVVSDVLIPHGTTTITSLTADVISASDFLPFGAEMTGRTYNKGQYNYGYSGKLNENDISGGVGNHLDFGARIHDSRTGRWLSLDPLQSKYPSLSPYNFVGNSPIKFIDPNGKEIVISEPVGSKAYIRISDALKEIQNTNPKLYAAVHGSPIKVYITVDGLNPTANPDKSIPSSGRTFVMSQNSFSEKGGETVPVFAQNPRVTGVVDVTFDVNGNAKDASIEAKYSSEEASEWDDANKDNPNAEPGWSKKRAYTDAEAKDQNLISVKSISIKIDKTLSEKEFTRLVRHELGHAKFNIENPIKAWIWKVGNLGKNKPANGKSPGHDTNNPSGTEADNAEKPE